jgi:hypothetical protein
VAEAEEDLIAEDRVILITKELSPMAIPMSLQTKRPKKPEVNHGLMLMILLKEGNVLSPRLVKIPAAQLQNRRNRLPNR